MKIGQRDVWIGVGKGERTPRKWWVVFTPLGREWISPGVAGQSKGFWLNDVPRRFGIHGPTWNFMLALTPESRWAKMKDRKVVGWQWIEWRRRRMIDESDTTVEEFDAMWEDSDPVETDTPYDWADDETLGYEETMRRFEALGPDVTMGPSDPPTTEVLDE